jgi:hypothetical protein
MQQYGPPPGGQQQWPSSDWRPAATPKNGFGIAALALSLIGLLFCLMPITGFIGLGLGLLGFLFAALGLGRVRRGVATNKGMSIAALVLSVLAIVGGFIAMKMFFDIVGNFGRSESPPAAVSGPSDAATASVEQPPGEFTAGQTVDRDGLQITAAPLAKDRAYGQKVLCSMVTYRNTGETEASFNQFDWKIQSPKGVQESAYSAEKEALNSGQLAPGGTVAGNVCIKDPGLKGDYLIINESFFADPVRWKATL